MQHLLRRRDSRILIATLCLGLIYLYAIRIGLPWLSPVTTYLNQPISVSEGLSVDEKQSAGRRHADRTPMLTARRFLELAERDVASRELNSCDGRLGRELIQAYIGSKWDYCNTQVDDNPSHIDCFPVKRSSFSNWWPYPNAFCTASNLRPIPNRPEYLEGNCKLTVEGKSLKVAMKNERFLGQYFTEVQAWPIDHQKQVNYTTLIINRQDEWNPYHVAEDLVTTILALLLVDLADPMAHKEPIQLAFSDKFGLDHNHYSSLWDRIGSRQPRRLSLDPYESGTTLSKVIYSVGSGSSLLSAIGIDTEYHCASTLVWAASHYYRHLFGLQPPNVHRPSIVINILWLSRSKLNHHLDTLHKLSDWQKDRELKNEPVALFQLEGRIRDFCLKTRLCDYEDVEADPSIWSLDDSEAVFRWSRRPKVRFWAIDPFVHTLESQIDIVGHTSILVGLHGGAMGLSLFMPPGSGAILELHTENTVLNHHFHNMASQLGRNYKTTTVLEQSINVDKAWRELEGLVMEQLPS